MKYIAAIVFSLIIYSCSNSNANSKIIPQIIDSISIAKSDSVITKPKESFSKDVLLGKLTPKNDSSFIRIEKTYTNKSNIYLRKNTYTAYCKMYAAAAKEGLQLKIISAFRSNYHQKRIWEAKWTGKRKVGGRQLNIAIVDERLRAKEILKYSSMPGSSRHHWGTDIDIYDLNNSTFEAGTGLKIYNWLRINAASYGFYQVYTAGRTVGYKQEKWHWSYLPIAKPMLDAYRSNISIEDFSGFKGANTAADVHIIENYVLGINPECL